MRKCDMEQNLLSLLEEMSKKEDEQQMSGISSARSGISNDDVSISTGESSMMTSACLLEVVRAASMTSALLFERNQKSAGAQELVSVVMASAYLLEEAGISNADVSISVEKRRGIRSLLKLLSTDTVRRVTVDKAVGRYYYRSCWQTSPFKREGICD
ncbi:cyclin-dependent kinase G-2-like [Dorcoceras hygrometricum]|uniref:Cyclin-dependent kinase G-2-like n=1 Tax=Dorcoceras hygrometricum TaxID=472368 RepID=A0A2Z6ZWQ3_9LAMI|nr:cyclin-dependent kinase G-2-like [Dorcoceras hygrometricum]